MISISFSEVIVHAFSMPWVFSTFKFEGITYMHARNELDQIRIRENAYFSADCAFEYPQDHTSTYLNVCDANIHSSNIATVTTSRNSE